MHEIIHVVEPESFSGPQQPSRARSENEPLDGEALAAGYYVVLWSKRLSRRLRKRYFGPFATLTQAEMLQKSALVLGIAHEENAVPSIKPAVQGNLATQPAIASGTSWFRTQSAGMGPDPVVCVA